MLRDLLHKQLAFDGEARFIAPHLVNRDEVLAEQAAPDQMVGGVVDGQTAHFSSHLVSVPAALDEACAGLAALSADRSVAEAQRHLPALLEPVRAAQQQSIERIGGGGGVLPAVGLLLREQPYAQPVHRFVVRCYFREGRHDVGVRGDMGFKGTVFLRPVDSDLLIFLCAFLETLDHQLCGLGVAAAL